MPRDERLAVPATEDALAAAAAVLDRRVADATPIEEGINALYRLEFTDGSRAVLKAPTIATETEFLAEPTLLDRIGAETAVPAPPILATAQAAATPLDTACYVMAYVEGSQCSDVLDLPASTHERLVREAGAHLAAIHDLSVEPGWGHLSAVDGDLVARPERDSWPALFADLTDDALDALLGAGPLSDAEPRFEDLEPTIREALTDSQSLVSDAAPPRSFVAGDYRPANLVLATDDRAAPLVRGVLDVGGLVADGLLDVAMAEDALIDTPFGGTDRADRLRDAYQTAYATARGDDRETLFDDRYPVYRLYARTDRLSALDYLAQFARESDADAVERRWRSFVDDRLAEVRARS